MELKNTSRIYRDIASRSYERCMRCHRNLIKFLKVAIAIGTIFFGSDDTIADDQPNMTSNLKQQLIDAYVKSAFVRGDQLVRPLGIPRIAYYCPGEFCNSLLIKLKSDFPSYVMQTETSSENSESEIVVSFYPSSERLNISKFNYVGPPGSQVEYLNFGECRLGRYKIGPKIIKEFVLVVVQKNNRPNEACVLTEVLRGSGLEFSESYKEYSKHLEQVSDYEFEMDTVLATANAIELHWAAPTLPGMNSIIVREVLNKFVKSVQK